VSGVRAIAERYLRFADQEAAGSSPTYEAWARAMAGDARLLEQLSTLTVGKQQPNLVLAALRWHGHEPGDPGALTRGLVDDWDQVRATVLARSTQTNEPARCAVLLPLLHEIRGPVALIELGASAGLCLLPDRYGYAYSDGKRLAPPAGSDLVIGCTVKGTLPRGLGRPEVASRIGIDLNPLDPTDADARTWLLNLVWPEHEHRRDRLRSALDVAATCSVEIRAGDIRGAVGDLVAAVPGGVTPVVLHSAALAYLNDDARAAVIEEIRASGARWVSFEGRGVVPLEREVEVPVEPDTLFVAALDGEPLAVADGHGTTMTLLSRT
jgi:hypothetical protein